MWRTLISLAIVIVVAASAPGAQSTAKKGRSASPTTQPTSRASVKYLRGEIVSVNIETKVITVKTTNKQHETSEVTVATDEKTQFTLDGAAVTLVDLKPAMPVTIQPDTGPATKVTAKSPPAIRKPKNNGPANNSKGR